MAKQVGFIGLGMMGIPMSKNLLKAGFELTVWNRTASKMKEIVEARAKPETSAKEVAQKSEVTITMLTGSLDPEEVILGKNGVLEGMKPGAVVIDMSTISPAVSKRIASEVTKKGCKTLDAPVGGTVSVAANAALTFQVGGDRQVFEEHRDIFGPWERTSFTWGRMGQSCGLCQIRNFSHLESSPKTSCQYRIRGCHSRYQRLQHARFFSP